MDDGSNHVLFGWFLFMLIVAIKGIFFSKKDDSSGGTDLMEIHDKENEELDEYIYYLRDKH